MLSQQGFHHSHHCNTMTFIKVSSDFHVAMSNGQFSVLMDLSLSSICNVDHSCFLHSFSSLGSWESTITSFPSRFSSPCYSFAASLPPPELSALGCPQLSRWVSPLLCLHSGVSSSPVPKFVCLALCIQQPTCNTIIWHTQCNLSKSQ